MTILVTNDDGINSEGLKVLAENLEKLGQVFIIAPDRQRSAVGLSITLERPLRVERLDAKRFLGLNPSIPTFSVDGMPADCVTLALYKLMESPPDLIVSGINNGQNLGYDIYHSGTVGAAMVGTMFGIPSMAVSIANKGTGNREQGTGDPLTLDPLSLIPFGGEHHDIIRYDTAAQVTMKLAEIILQRKLPSGTLLNINVPNVPLQEIAGIEVTRHCSTTYSIEVHHRLDPRGKGYYWLGGEFQGRGESPETLREDRTETDLSALRRRKVSITPLRMDLTDYAMMRELSKWLG